MKSILFLIKIYFITSFFPLPAQNEITFFDYWLYYSDTENSLYKHHCNTLFRQLSERKNVIDRILTKADWEKRKAFSREKLMRVIDVMPEKTPLNPKVTGMLQKEDYRIEKIVYESLPGYYVTGAIYIPDGIHGKAPAIFYACGHSLEGFRAEIYQHIIVNLVKKGFVVFTIDPMGQGERYEYWNKDENKPVFPVPDHQHSYAGAQCLISGYSVASYFIWDVIRGIDYMISRQEVDPDRIGMTGRSGGGNLTAYLGAIDDRIVASAPECYITNYEYLCKSIGPQCAEQNLYQLILQGLDHADFIIARAPKPTLILSTTRDIFSIQGARESYIEAKRMYDMLDSGEKLIMVEDDTVHSSTKKMREAMYAFFQEHLENPGNPEDLIVEIPDPDELQATETGQVVTSYDGETLFSMNKLITNKQIADLERSRKNNGRYLENIPINARLLSGFNYPGDYGKPVFSGRILKSGYSLEKYLVPGSGDYMLPMVLLKPSVLPAERIVMILDPQGINHALNQDNLAHLLLNKGFQVLLFDLPGIGSMGPGYLKGDSYIEEISYNQWFAAVLAGNSHVGLRSEDLVRTTRFIKHNLTEITHISAIAIGPLGSELLHAAVFDQDIKKICLIRPFLSYGNIATTRFYKPEYIPFTVAGAIEKYDLPDLMAAIIPRKILILNPKRADGTPASDSDIQDEFAFPLRVYLKEKFESNISAVSNFDNERIHNEVLLWLEK